MTSNNNSTDDGSLSFLNIQPDEANKHFNCPETTQQKLINLQFWLIDFIEDVKTKFGANRFLVKIKFKKDDPESEAKKFFTNSSEIKYILQEIKKRNAFPRKVTMGLRERAIILSKKIFTVVCPSGVLFGGNANNSANAGLSYANTNNTATNTNANIGSQLY